MAKQPTKKPASKTVTLATGAKVSGPSAVVDKLAKRAEAEVKARAEAAVARAAAESAGGGAADAPAEADGDKK